MGAVLKNPGPGYPAVFSPDRGYRYTLWRDLDVTPTQPGYVMFIGLNPSTADERTDDPTMSRVKGFARSWGYRHVVMMNLFAFRATKPANLKRAADPVGLYNDQWLVRCAEQTALVVCAWGNHGVYQRRDKIVVDLLMRHEIRLHVLDITKTGMPAHPLFLPAKFQPIPWNGY